MNELGYFDQMKLNRIYNSAIDQCKRVDKAKEKCESACSAINCYIQSMSESWRGDGATAVCEKLEELKAQINRSVEALTALSAEMYVQAGKVKTEWPALNIEKMTTVTDIEAE